MPSTNRLSAIGRPRTPASAPSATARKYADEVDLRVAGLREVDLVGVA